MKTPAKSKRNRSHEEMDFEHEDVKRSVKSKKPRFDDDDDDLDFDNFEEFIELDYDDDDDY